jgi:hypothetical protein
MIDFTSGSVFKLKEAEPDSLARAVEPVLITGEKVVGCFKAVRDYVVFTDKRLIAVNVQGMTEKNRTSRLFRTTRSRHGRWRRQGASIEMQNSTSGLAASGRSGSSSRVGPRFVG